MGSKKSTLAIVASGSKKSAKAKEEKKLDLSSSKDTIFDLLSREGLSGKIEWVDKKDLHLDESYQRTVINPRLINYYRDHWNWKLCQPLIIFKRNGDEYYIGDGGNRWKAAMQRDNITELPCWPIETYDQKEEAKIFNMLNTFRKNLSAYDIFHASLAAGDEITMTANEIVKSTGHRLAPTYKGDPRNVICVSTIMKLCRTNKLFFEHTWKVVTQICKKTLIQGRLLQGIFYIEMYLNQKLKKSVLDSDYYKGLISLSHQDIIKGIIQEKEYYGKFSSKICAKGIARVFNKGRRANLIEIE